MGWLTLTQEGIENETPQPSTWLGVCADSSIHWLDVFVIDPQNHRSSCFIWRVGTFQFGNGFSEFCFIFFSKTLMNKLLLSAILSLSSVILIITLNPRVSDMPPAIYITLAILTSLNLSIGIINWFRFLMEWKVEQK